MTDSDAYPGTRRHQALLRAIVSRYENDPRVLAVVLFGSLAGDTWDALSDIDCDIVVADNVNIDALCEIRLLADAFDSIGEKLAFVIPDEADAGDVQLESLMQFSIRYHPLAQTSPNIIRRMKVLAGCLDHGEIARAGTANRISEPPLLAELLDGIVRNAVVASACLLRDQFWSAVEVLHRMRSSLMDLYAITHGGERAWQYFDAYAHRELQARLRATLPSSSMASLRASLTELTEILESELSFIAANEVGLTSAHRVILRNIRKRLGATMGERSG